MIKSVSVKGQVVLPSKMRRRYGIAAGSPVNISDTGHGILIEPVSADAEAAVFLEKSPIDGGPVILSGQGQKLSSRQVARILEETE